MAVPMPALQDPSTLCTAPQVNTATALNGERSYLHLSRADTVVAAVAALDARIDCDPTSSPVQAGTLEKFPDPYGRGRMSFVYRLLGNEEVIVIIPMRADTSEMALAVDQVIDVALGAMKP